MAIGTPTSLGEVFKGTAGTTTTLTATASASVGDLVVLDMGCTLAGATISSAVDDAGNTYAVAVNANGAGNSLYAIGYAILTNAITSGVTIFTVTWSASVSQSLLFASKATGIAAVPLDKTSPATNGNTVNWNSGATTTTSQADELLWGGSFDNAVNDTTSVAGGSFTEIHDKNSGVGGGYSMTSAYRIVAATAAYTASGTWTATGGDSTKAAIATFKAAVDATSGLPVFQPVPFMSNGRI